MHDWGSDWTVDTLLDPLTTVSLQIRDNELRKCVGRSDPVTLTAVPCVPCEVNAVLLGEPPLRVGIDGPAWRRGHRPLDPLLLTEHSILKPVRRGSPPGPASRPAGECETGLRRWTPYLLRGIPKRALISLSRPVPMSLAEGSPFAATTSIVLTGRGSALHRCVDDGATRDLSSTNGREPDRWII